MPSLTVNLMGSFTCREPGGSRVALPTRKAKAIVAYLAMTPGKEQSREMLAGLLWGEYDELRARANLRKTLSRLRRALPKSCTNCLIADPRRIALRPDAVQVDVALFEDLAGAGTPETLEQAAQLYRSVLLDGFEDCGSAFAEWLAVERRRLEETARHVLERLLDHYVITGAADRAIQIALRLLAMDPLQEDVHRALIRLYVFQERIGSAQRQYIECRDILTRDLGVEPSPETQHLFAEVLRKTPRGASGGAGSVPETDDLPERATVIQSGAKTRARLRAELSGSPSIAVLPFAVIGDAAASAYLGDGMVEDIITELGRFSELDVIAPATALSYKRARIPAEGVGRELGTRYVLHGTVRVREADLRITVRLVESETAVQIWGERYDCTQGGLFQIQDELVRQLVVALVGRIESEELNTIRRKPPNDWQAYDYWLRGWHVLRQRADTGTVKEARQLFQRAVDKDPDFARAYVGLASAHLSEWYCYSWSHWAFVRREALDFARRAVALDPNDHKALCMLGMTELFTGDYALAHQRISKAVNLNPNDTDVLANAAMALSLIGDHEAAVNAGRTALRLAPHCPEWYGAFAGTALFAARFYDEAIETMAFAPEALCDTPAFIAACHAHLGQAEKAAQYRDTVYRHYNLQGSRGEVKAGQTCLDWLLALNPFHKPPDLEHFERGLRRAGFA